PFDILGFVPQPEMNGRCIFHKKMFTDYVFYCAQAAILFWDCAYCGKMEEYDSVWLGFFESGSRLESRLAVLSYGEAKIDTR
ncbi:MAG: hypothetical protein PVG35_17915, partial [Desulfobacterales bacterium]